MLIMLLFSLYSVKTHFKMSQFLYHDMKTKCHRKPFSFLVSYYKKKFRGQHKQWIKVLTV